MASRPGFLASLVLGVLIGALASGGLGRLALASRGDPSEPPPKDNPELARLYDEDQADRMPGEGKPIDWSVVGPRDKKRRARVYALYETGEIRTGKDFQRAAMVLQHAEKPDEYLLAHEFCVVALSKGERDARWLAAATEDRFLMKIGRPPAVRHPVPLVRSRRQAQASRGWDGGHGRTETGTGRAIACPGS
jgi:hypothetical protein